MRLPHLLIACIGWSIMSVQLPHDPTTDSRRPAGRRLFLVLAEMATPGSVLPPQRALCFPLRLLARPRWSAT